MLAKTRFSHRTTNLFIRRLGLFRKAATYDNVIDGLKISYKEKLLPLEEHHQFHQFYSPKLNDPDFEAKPMILLMGQYSTGKTSLIRFILERDFPGMRIGPEPTTDRFIAVMYDKKTGVIPGNALVVDPSKPFAPLAKFGNAFLTKFQCSTLDSTILKGLTLVDTPGILSGEKQRVDRGYEFTGVLEWFAERVDRIILLFDAHKLDISDEFKRSIESLKGQDDKVRIVLNKADMVDHQALMRVYGSLMWSLGKVFKTPEVSRVYIGSFWDEPLRHTTNKQLFEDEAQDLLKDMQLLPRNAALRKLNDLSKRARFAKVHAYIIDALKKEMPSLFKKEAKKMQLIEHLDKTFERLQKDLGISRGDFPDVHLMQELLLKMDFTTFRRIDGTLMRNVDELLTKDITKLMQMLPQEDDVKEDLKGGVFSSVSDTNTPFGYRQGEGVDAGKGDKEWVVALNRANYDLTFDQLESEGGKLKRAVAKSALMKSKLPNPVLSKIYILADVDDDGVLDKDEFALANYLIQLKLDNYDLPTELPEHLVPPSKRTLT